MDLEKFKRSYRRSQRFAMIAIAGSEYIGVRLQRLALRFLTLRARYLVRWRAVQATMSEEQRAVAAEVDRQLAGLDLMRTAARQMRDEDRPS